ncbi:hypothetical protein F8M41_011099 [Gigaspora margarita]|uniref:Uncharacterized protein n=1 Tax=Gigaspora margarita TaxID=4874 RepID=A0A8H4EQ24_GIGMA|nr:hypothetical protein F8M41_011099 [Gigaspora margarita]
MVYDQANSQFGIASRINIDYGSTPPPAPTFIPPPEPTPTPPHPPTQAEIWIQLPTLIPSDIKCLLITDSDGNVQSILEDIYVDPNDYFKIPTYVAKQGFSYKFAFYSEPPNDGSSCSGNFLVETAYLMAVITNNPWLIGRNQYSVQDKSSSFRKGNQLVYACFV